MPCALDISIHAPLAGCDLYKVLQAHTAQISIHAPLAGRDNVVKDPYYAVAEFQSTRPLRGATAICSKTLAAPFNFNPRTPCGVRRCRAWYTRIGMRYFNPRTPCGVRLLPLCIWLFLVIISIHAPLAGCDHSQTPCTARNRYFNPRTPCGVRPRSTRRCRFPDPRFQSTHPLRGATAMMSHPPRGIVFQSTHPLRGATRQNEPLFIQVCISIHAPLAGCDRGRHRRGVCRQNFNPRTPCGARHSGRPRVSG